jgi:hypothetical protein
MVYRGSNVRALNRVGTGYASGRYAPATVASYQNAATAARSNVAPIGHVAYGTPYRQGVIGAAAYTPAGMPIGIPYRPANVTMGINGNAVRRAYDIGSGFNNPNVAVADRTLNYNVNRDLYNYDVPGYPAYYAYPAYSRPVYGYPYGSYPYNYPATVGGTYLWGNAPRNPSIYPYFGAYPPCAAPYADCQKYPNPNDCRACVGARGGSNYCADGTCGPPLL